MKKRTITIGYEVGNDDHDGCALEAVKEMWRGHGPGAASERLRAHVSVVSEPIPEPIVLKVTLQPDKPHNLTPQITADDLAAFLNEPETQHAYGGSFHVEVIPQ